MLDTLLDPYLTVRQPLWLLLLALAPLVLAIGRRSLAGLGGLRGWSATGVRCGVVALLVLALSGPERVHVTDDQTVVFVLDRSDSIPSDLTAAALEFVRQATDALRPGRDRAALVSFAGQPLIERLPHGAGIDGPLGPVSKPGRTDIAAGLRMGMALFPPNAARRVVLLSDGNETSGDAAAEGAAFAGAGVPIDVAPLRYRHEAEILVERLTAPSIARPEEAINLSLIVRSERRAAALIALFHDEAPLALADGPGTAIEVELEPGFNRYTFPVTPRSAAVHRFRAVVTPVRAGDDTIVANNEGRAFTTVAGAETALVLCEGAAEPATPDGDAVLALAAALRQAGMDCRVAGLEAQELDAAALSGCALVVLSNVSGLALGEQGQRALASYVRDLGGGLIAVGGDRAFSVGGYYKTPLEDILPVETERAKLKLPSVSMVIVIDRSGSMAGEKLDLAKAAAAAAVRLLGTHDRIGVIAFDGGSEWVVPLGPCGDKRGILAALSTIGAGGGTVMHPALEAALTALQGGETNIRHVIVLTDGQSAPGDFEALARQYADAGVTISAIAVGSDADQALLGRIAAISGGRMYVTASARPLPQILARETVLASRSGLFERPFQPVLRRGAGEAVLAGFDQSEIPPLRGYVVTAAKPFASVPLLNVHENGADPILAYWHIGLGRAVAFTSGLWPRWGPEWVSWPGFSKLWGQCARFAARPAQSPDFTLTTALDGEQARLLVEAHGLPPAAQSALSLRAVVVDPDFVAADVHLTQTGPGRFEAVFDAPDPGAYITRVAYSYGGSRAAIGSLQAGLVVNYSPELTSVEHDESLLVELARRTGGRVLSLADPRAVFEPWSIRPVRTRVPLWETLVRLALGLFLVDVAIRRLALTPAELLGSLRRRIAELAGRPVGDTAATLTTLRGARRPTREDAALPVLLVEENPHDSADGRTGAPGASADAADDTSSPEQTSEAPNDYAERLLRA
ncbi:MAG TPA: VWA domain-containing protein, partial [Phycisphaerae bacterium]|nr:VWA domain-containing protein [Phycisphaerae bacterium]